MRILTTVILIAGLGGLACADTLTLRSGEAIEGNYLGGTARQIRIDVNGEIRTYDVGQVQAVTFVDTSYQAPPPPPAPPPPQASSYPAQGVSSGVTIPADTAITIRMIDAVNSQNARLGQTFRASVDEPVMVDGRPVIPRGADVVTKLVEDRQSGKIEGKALLTLALVSVNINGQAVEVTSTDLKTESSSRGNRSAGVIGGGTALGAILGGLAGGGKGAAIGAVSGAAVGTGAEVLTNGQQVKIPSETRLTFRLQTPVQI